MVVSSPVKTLDAAPSPPRFGIDTKAQRPLACHRHARAARPAIVINVALQTSNDAVDRVKKDGDVLIHAIRCPQSAPVSIANNADLDVFPTVVNE
mmetsp:Transcript_19454/g.61173  ORF Transcript_19454/g.61173 Transcript_19454/m.61173 type:complete len:95 (+) Transcript_19454:753-1037(+)